ncbi:MAG: BON domain-containing protein [Candidatus Caenarcaniphilales bacterium]|nr:BON domain-containing protein [Candidatus Caenarcaniphilales bacterium]
MSDDQVITRNVKLVLTREPQIEGHKVIVSTKKHVVYLKGELTSESAIMRADQIARQVGGVRAVVNMLRISP